MFRKKTSMTMDGGLLDRVDAVRGDVPRVRWIEEAIRLRLGESHERTGRGVDGFPQGAGREHSRVAGEEVRSKGTGQRGDVPVAGGGSGPCVPSYEGVVKPPYPVKTGFISPAEYKRRCAAWEAQYGEKDA